MVEASLADGQGETRPLQKMQELPLQPAFRSEATVPCCEHLFEAANATPTAPTQLLEAPPQPGVRRLAVPNRLIDCVPHRVEVVVGGKRGEREEGAGEAQTRNAINLDHVVGRQPRGGVHLGQLRSVVVAGACHSDLRRVSGPVPAYPVKPTPCCVRCHTAHLETGRHHPLAC